MLEVFTLEQCVVGERERAAILANPNAPGDLRRWAESYSGSRPPQDGRRRYIEDRYKNLRWLRFRSEPASRINSFAMSEE